jgi:hypothetical protein
LRASALAAGGFADQARRLICEAASGRNVGKVEMPDHRSHRGMHPDDAKLFAPEQWPALAAAVSELSWLLSHGYAQPSALKIVGDRHGLDARQRMAVMRCACTDDARLRRAASCITHTRGEELHIDGYNVLTTIEAALSGGVILAARDSTYRDVASIHGSYRKVEETLPAIRLIGEALAELAPSRCLWLLDRPVSNSGRLKTILLEQAAANGWNWQVEIVPNPDAVLCTSSAVVCTADSVILDSAARWFNLARHIVTTKVPRAFSVDLSRD